MTLVSGSNLEAKDSIGISDPYVKIVASSPGAPKFRSRTVYKTLEPEWNDTFEMERSHAVSSK